ncbi:hypothetical protein ACFL60_00315 [Candidatus Omnitrophota bacterium]
MTFEKLFGIEESLIKETCILLPLLKKNVLKYLDVKSLSKGKVYSSGNSGSFSVIHTGMGAPFTGDAALYLEQTQCKNIILFGSCGLVKETKDLKVGSLVTPHKCYSLESFSNMLSEEKGTWRSFSADKDLTEIFLKTSGDHSIQKITCATLGSLKLEEDYLEIFEQKNIHVVDMECSSLFSASKHVKKRAMALFYITDIINKKPFYIDLGDKEKTILSSSIKSAATTLCEFIEKNLSA